MCAGFLRWAEGRKSALFTRAGFYGAKSMGWSDFHVEYGKPRAYNVCIICPPWRGLPMRKEQLKKLRRSLGLTQTELATYLGLRDKSQVSHLENGRTPIDGPVRRLLHILEATGGDLFPEKNTERG